MKKPACFLDRDGTIIEDRRYLADPDAIEFIPGAIEALRLLQKQYLLFIVTHQGGVSEGRITMDEVNRVNAAFRKRVEMEGIHIEEIYVCPHQRKEECECIKPKTYFPEKASEEYGIDLSRSVSIGDHPHDAILGRNFGGRGIYLLTGHGEKHSQELPPGIPVAPDLSEAASMIIGDLHS